MNQRITLEAIAPGDTHASTRVTISEAHIVWFAGLTGDFNPLHMDEESASKGPFGRRIAHGMLSYSMSTGMRSRIDDWEILAFLETSRRFKGPVFAGDTLHYVATVREVRPSASKRDRGVVRVAMVLHNQDGAVVQEGEDVFSVATGVQA
ncbi:MaoC/PaaZ C-terminal domain-containing protein [Variovorax sp. LjRoot84]|uniref:MaoC family dehydratase n=1 Tax=Variovorax sp. LjRoot84 TaxID=3342340 RepID=UPI003ECE0CB8